MRPVHIVLAAGIAFAAMFIAPPLIGADSMKFEKGNAWACVHHKTEDSASETCYGLLPTFLEFP